MEVQVLSSACVPKAATEPPSCILQADVRIYSDLAPWFHLLTHPSDYAEEADFIERVIDTVAVGPVSTLLELGSGGGNNASHLKRRFTCTLTDLSPEMLALSSSLNPECEHVQGDMRTLRLERAFDAVLVHDAVMYLTTEADLHAAIETAAVHLRPGGVVVFVPDATLESYAVGTDHGGHDGDDGRSLRYLEWAHAPKPGATTAEVDYVVVMREPGQPPRVVQDAHTVGLFPESTWRRLLADAGLEIVDPGVVDPNGEEHAVFVARRPT
ncbi:MAG: class I SAM-dependent methyltransferase [Thermoleophilia bacterium]|nr:class I SAM-dependent methyltransferase [Thermoleophilia bacterium]